MLSSGTRLGPYEIVSAVGAGGMGEVYRANDTRLGRTVAVKVLGADISGDPAFKLRFEREARAISQLSHPNICALYDVGSHDGTEFLVMELLEGQTLADRLEKGPLPLDQVLRYGTEIAGALDRAHRHGIVHRDLKPGNVMLTRNGVKLLDFGLAKIVAPSVGPAQSGLSALPTEAPANRPLTEDGTILGTFQYMAPEQVEGRDSDARTDIFALGSLLYEMATGKKAFSGRSRASMIAAIIERDPGPISAAAPMSPPPLDRLVQGCLEKDPDDRWQSAHDVASQLKWIAQGGSQAGIPAPVSTRRRLREHGAWFVAGASALVAVAFATFWLRGASAPPVVVRSSILPPENSHFSFAGDNAGPPTLSPDGRKLAFVAVGKDRPVVYLRPLDGLEATILPGTEDATFPFWSPDSRSLGFFAQGKLKRIEVAESGSATTICAAPNARGGAWNREGIILFTPDTRSVIFRVPAAGGTPVPVTKLDAADDTTHRWPVFLPDGRHFLFFAGNHNQTSSETSGIRFASLDGTGDRFVVRTLSNAIFASGNLLFLRGNTLLAQAFDPRTGRPSAEARPVADGVFFDLSTWHGAFTASQNNVLAYEAGATGASNRLVWYDRGGKFLGTLGEKANYYGQVRISPDGRRVAASIGDPGDIYVFDVGTGLKTRLTFSPASTQIGAWSPDGTRIAYSAIRQKMGRFGIFTKLASGSEPEREMLSAPGGGYITDDWSRDGRFISYQINKQLQPRNEWLLPAAGKTPPFPLLAEHDGDETSSAMSPDSRWIAYQVFTSGAPSVTVSPLPGPGGKWQVAAAGYNPRWRGDGKELYFMAPDLTLMSVPVDGTGTEFRVGAVTPLFHTRAASNPTYGYDVTADGQKFIVSSLDTDQTAPITLVVNWRSPLPR